MIPLLPCGDGAAVRRRHIQEGAALQLLMYLRLYRLRGPGLRQGQALALESGVPAGAVQVRHRGDGDRLIGPHQ